MLFPKEQGARRSGSFLAFSDFLWETDFYTPPDSALILIATWYRQGPAMTQQFNVNHGHPDGDLSTSILAYEWFLECQKTYSNKYGDWKTNAMLEWKACSKVGLIHHVLVAIHESVLVLKHTFDEHGHAFPEVPKRRFGSPGYSTLLLHSVSSTPNMTGRRFHRTMDMIPRPPLVV